MKDRKFKFTFKLGLLIYTVIAAVLIVAGLKFFWDFIGDYEKSMPIHEIEEIAENIQDGNIDMYFKGVEAYQVSPFETGKINADSYLLEVYKNYIKDKKVSIIKSKDYTDKSPAYVIKADDKKIAEITLVSNKRNDSNFKMWEFGSISVENYYKELISTSSVKVKVPSEAKVTVNGVEVSSDYIVENNDIEELSAVAEYMAKVPTMVTYEITGLLEIPEVKAVLFEEEMVLTETDGVYSGTFGASDDFVTEMTEYVDKVAVAYAKNFINVQKKILPYVMKNSDLYTSIKSATTGWYPKIKSYEFTEKSYDNFQVYGDDCFSCDVKYVVDIVFKNYSDLDDPTEKGDFKFYFVLKDDTWYLTSLSYNY
ncbi:MAG: hypothetical protein E7266_01325 [Lachnospiraceae bacterium]|nr:hypothetical protein [Lachnospiraceae bacterium]